MSLGPQRADRLGHSEAPGLPRPSMILVFVGLLAAAVALTVLYRELSIRTIIEFGEQSNASIANAAVNAVFPELVAFLNSPPPDSARPAPADLPEGLLRVINGTPRTTPVARIKIYNAQGIILHSSLVHEIGTDDSANPRFQESMRGRLHSRLQYHDAFDIFAPASIDDNLIETYVPIHQPGRLRPIGVFEVYSDANAMVRTMNRNELLILSGIGLIIAVLYGLLVFAMRRSERVITAQGRTILERNHELEMLSARALAAEESERRRVAVELHEDIAQDLSAAKYKLEAASSQATAAGGNASAAPSDEVIRLLQEAIRDVRNLAVELRPPSFDDFGLVTTTRALCRQIEDNVAGLDIHLDITVPEEAIPDALKIVIFRIVQQSLHLLAQTPGVTQIGVLLRRAVELELILEFGCTYMASGDTDEQGSLMEIPYIAAPWSRAILSGGAVRMTRGDGGICRCRASWAV